jgi:tripartite-type tricarboxylate transporter receptor subunit TctC
MRAPPDGYTLLITTSSTMIASLVLSKNVPFHPGRDFTPIGNMYESQQVLVGRGALPLNTLQEVLAYAKKNPGKLTYASSGIGSSFHFSGESLKQSAGIDLLHVPYKGTGRAAVAIISGEVDLAFPTMGNLGGNAGKVKVIALNSAQRNARLPGVPTIAEVVPGYRRIPGWIAMFGPAGMDAAVVNRVNADMVASMKTQPVREAFEQQFTNAIASSPAELAATIKADLELSQQLAKQIGIKPE